MPKLLVLLEGEDEATAVTADAIVEGARSVRFAEADLRRVGEEPHPGMPPRIARIRRLDDAAALAAYDAIVVGAPTAPAPALADLLTTARPLGMGGGLANKLGSVFPLEAPAAVGAAHPLWPLLDPMATYGMILVPPGYAGPTGESEDHLSAARRLGRRLIDIAAWITHARSHHHH